MNFTYLVIDLLIILFPLLLTFEGKIKYYSKMKAVIISIIIVGIPFISWDIYATYKNDWAFNDNFILGFKILGLPIEEIMFFIVVPYSMIFLWETAKYYLPSKKIVIPRYLYLVLSISSFLLAINFINKNYTLTVLIFFGIMQFIYYYFKFSIIENLYAILFLVFTFVPFFIANYYLTSFPVVNYNSMEIINLRVTTIPVEDFIYSFVLILSYITVYELSEAKWLKK